MFEFFTENAHEIYCWSWALGICSLLFIIIPTKYFLTKRKISLWILLLVYFVYKVKGKEEKLIKNDNFIYKINKRQKFNMI